MSKTYEVITLGCKVNEYESQFYAEQLEKIGLKPYIDKNTNSGADVIVINTCTVTNTAAKKSRQKIRRARKENPGALCVVVGCYAQTMEEETRQNLEADLLIGASHKNQLAALVAKELESRQSLNLVEPIENIVDFESMPIGHFESRNRAFLKIQDGCNQYCAYCQIPLARGPERSQIPEQVIEVAKSLSDQGLQEIVLTGIHTGRYHFRQTNLTDLLKQLLEQTPENVTYRLSSIEITEVTDELIQLMKENSRILPHLHIPIQAGSNATLNRMKRPYTIGQFKERLDWIRQNIPDISVSTDVITGFVQESEEEFQDTLKNLDEMNFSFLHVFPYSRRKGTAADAMSGFVDPAIVKQRTSALLELSDQLRYRDMQRFTESEVLIEQAGEAPGTWLGYTSQYHPAIVHADENKTLSGRVSVSLKPGENHTYEARPVN